MSALAAAAQLAMSQEMACGGFMYSGQQLTAGCDPHAVTGTDEAASFLFIADDGTPMRATVTPVEDE